MPRHQHFDLSTLIATLRQSKDTIDSVFDDLYPNMDWMSDMTMEEMEKLDSIIFRCADCGTWLEVGEMAPLGEDCEQYCTDCKSK